MCAWSYITIMPSYSLKNCTHIIIRLYMLSKQNGYIYTATVYIRRCRYVSTISRYTIHVQLPCLYNISKSLSTSCVGFSCVVVSVKTCNVM